MNLKGIIATWDALNTQTKNVKAVIDAGVTILFLLKEIKKNFIMI